MWVRNVFGSYRLIYAYFTFRLYILYIFIAIYHASCYLKLNYFYNNLLVYFQFDQKMNSVGYMLTKLIRFETWGSLSAHSDLMHVAIGLVCLIKDCSPIMSGLQTLIPLAEQWKSQEKKFVNFVIVICHWSINKWIVLIYLLAVFFY